MLIRNIEVEVVLGDITEMEVDAIVNAANNLFVMGGGVAGAVKRKGGSIIEEEARQKGPKSVGDAVITSAGSLKAKYVIHAVTMKMDFITNEDIIRKATFNTLLLAQQKGIKSVAFPALGCGVGGFSYEAAAKIMAQEVFHYIMEVPNPVLRKILFVLFHKDAFDIFERNVCGYLQYITDKLSQGPFITVDGVIEYKGGIVMIERSNPPLGWALPGGFLDYGESVEEGVRREVKEETNLEFVDISLLGVYSSPKRDPRFHTVSVVFYGRGEGELKADSDAKDVKIFKLDHLPDKIAFDHRSIIEDYRRLSLGK